MLQNIIYLPSLANEYKSGLIFSIFDGLKSGNSLKLISDSKPHDLELLLQDAYSDDMNWTIEKQKDDLWELTLTKRAFIDKSEVGCCGMCGGHSKKE